ncbi:unnamed protein product [Symbiodinium necroappetens]|uniref:Uncharacterized protein n=1 Tax=Symbiodinium necroappetens TaxID=1628268 RepID=A0A812Y0P8_9DINO|nr:unnamed protein product [Symbiodinium necroappetens]
MRRLFQTWLLLQLHGVPGVRVDSENQTSHGVTSTTGPMSMVGGKKNDTLQKVEDFLSVAMGNQSTSGIVGVAKNTEGDFATMKTAFCFNLASSLAAFVAFTALRALVPAVYGKDAEEVAAANDGPRPLLALEPPRYRVRSLGDVASALFGWISVVRSMQEEEVVARCGLDGLQLLELLRLGGRLAALWGGAIMCLLCPLHFYLHLQLSNEGTLLSRTSLNGLAVDRLERHHHLLLIWTHAATVWFVVLAASYEVYAAQSRFLTRRFEWLKRIPEPRATTLLVENLPLECRSDFALHQYFARLFSREAIKSAYIVRRTDKRLKRLFLDMERLRDDLHCAQHMREPSGSRHLQSAWCCYRREDVGFYTRELEALQEAFAKERQAVEEGVMAMDPQVCSCAGFVTFTSRRMCMLARQPQYRADSSQLTVAMPPDPEDVRYHDLAKDPQLQASGNVTAAGLLLLIFIVWAPLIATFMDRVEPILLRLFEDFPAIQHLVQGVLSTGALKMFMAFLPTLLMAIISNVLTLKAGTWAQLKLQDWYFSFQVVFVLLVTAIVGTILDVLAKVLAHPGEVIYLLADALPGFSNFYINYLMLGCLLHVFDLLRFVQLAKYLLARFARGDNDPSEARKASEPEDQDSDGMGARMAKITLHIVVASVFASCCPLILIFAWLYCTIGSLSYGYLLIYAETKKPDMGGSFWVKSLRHLFAGLAIYVLLMVGLLSRACGPSREAPLVAALALLALGLGFHRFSALSWETLPFEAIVEVDLADRERGKHHGNYWQVECRPLDRRASQTQKRGDGTD